jgi:hypothetical protein
MSVSFDMRWTLAARMVLVAAMVGLSAWALWCVPVARATGSCSNEAFRTGPSAALPDCRAYEMVSPPDKNGGEVDGGIKLEGMYAPEQAAEDGEGVTYGSTSAFIGTESKSAVVASQYLSTRTAGGWVTRGIVPAQQLPGGKLELSSTPGIPDVSLFQGFSESLSDGFLLAWNPQPDPLAPVGYFNPYLSEGTSGGYRLLSEVTPPSWSPGRTLLSAAGFGVVYAGMSTDGQHVIFEANDALTPEAVPGRVNLYEWSVGRPLELVSVLPEGAVDTSGAEYPIGASLSMTFGSPLLNERPRLNGALSSNGMRAFWSGGSATGGQLYMHEIVGSEARSVDVSASQKSGQPEGGGEYWAANAEGSLVYFTSGLQLTDNSTATAGSADLYQYDVNTGELTDLTVDSNVGETAGVQAVLGVGGSGGESYVYFVAGGVLAGNESGGEKATPQTCRPEIKPATAATPCNLYVEHGGQTAFIATLGNFKAELLNYEPAPELRTSRVSPDGRLLAFQSTKPLTGYDNIPANGQPCLDPVRQGVTSSLYYRDPPEGRCMEVFEYDAQSAKLTCVSCETGGLPPTADSMLPETLHQNENVLGWESPTVQQRYLLDDGRLFFQSEDAVLAQATNGRQNIYEYEPEGVGQCAASGSGGCQYLISTGESSGNDYFADASADGRDVFFLTDEQLVPQDGDGAIDMYDAREGGGFSSAAAPPCSGEACKPAVTPAPAIYGPPSSATFQGAGDIPTQLAAAPSTRTTKKKKAKQKKSTAKKKAKKTARKTRRKITKRVAGESARRSERGRR